MPTTYTVPDNPTDVEAAVLGLRVATHPQVRQPGLSSAFWPKYAHTDAMQRMVPAPR
jgi:hypothetical protein